jgi:putative transposase
VRNHAGAMLACDFFVAITARFRTLYVFVVLEVGTRRIVHWNVTEHPTADWTVQHVPCDCARGSTATIFDSRPRQHLFGGCRLCGARDGFDGAETPVRCRQANAFCERLIGTVRRECLDWLIVLNERHLRWFCTSGWVTTTRATARQSRSGHSLTCRSTDWCNRTVIRSLMASE